MYRLHIANKNYSSWSLRPWVLMRALDIPFDEILHPFPEQGAWDQYRQFAPNGKVPCLQDGDLTIWDSLAIVEYLAEQHAGVWPGDTAARAWARSAVAEMHSGFQALRSTCGMNCGLRIELPGLSLAVQKDLARIDELWSQGVSRFGGPFLAGSQFTAVDAFFAPVAFRVQTYGLPLSAIAQAYSETLVQLAAMQQWYQAALLEPWRESAHEQEALDAGRLLADYRSA
ncbi:glutathione S-transferase family protein [Cellvibrio japonicus]|uniref:Putative glutathione S-transferase n=1 Tax=Cellvibrio japonicus (strain Ueda107) TaxID=498211 RepID=B3PIX3_CELJU|nr:glutathione S-transferase family protein [Cellvibrio japonicus]ACE85636.1 putative glutathione S-transferase [Cellvibrio japonicus Ueda107]QEI11182.1 glutathione S-transferase family protein [Cellvibrio japonicus]QEI14756.1 glutathione S-transferase family protein [Cellvibrio japonicus]QEI18336.1 glutathione S-transferase family protein [Cellvibrio japonicus]